MTEDAKIIHAVLESYSAGMVRKSLSGGNSLNVASLPMASVVVFPMSTAPVNSTSAPTPTASIATRPR